MNKINKYWYIHWGCSFFNLDAKTHDLAEETIWECLTSNASIYYHKPILPEDVDLVKYDLKIINKTRSSVIIQWQIIKDNESLVTWMFTFVKIKKAT